MNHINEPFKIVADAMALGVALITFFTTWLPLLLSMAASAVTLAWGLIRIYEWWKAKKENKIGNVKLD